MEGEAKLKKIPKQEYTPEFRELAVKRVKAGLSIGAVAKELGLVEQTLRTWVKAAAAGKLNGPGSKVVTPDPHRNRRRAHKRLLVPSRAWPVSPGS